MANKQLIILNVKFPQPFVLGHSKARLDIAPVLTLFIFVIKKT